MRSRPLTLLAVAGMAAAFSGGAVAGSPGPGEPRAVISQARGDFGVANSRDGQAIFQAAALAPGRSVTGSLQLSNTGSLTGELQLDQLQVKDAPGANGGRLSDAVHLDVADVTGGNAVPVFSGQLGVLHSRALGGIAPGEARTFRFTASLPDGGAPPTPTSGDNAYLGSALSVRYSWKATAEEPSGPGDGGTTGSAPTVSWYVVSKRLVKRGWLDVFVTCDQACNTRAGARLVKVKRHRKSVKARPRSAAMTLPGRKGRIRLKLSRPNRRALTRTLRRVRRVKLRVQLNVASAAGGPTRTYRKTVRVKRPKARHARRR
jgi:hypothetical protein